MALYVDGFVLPVRIARVADYRRLARAAGKVWMEHGALGFHECIADDVKPGKVTSFPQAVLLEPDETVMLSWILYRSRRHRDSVNRKVMADPRIAAMDSSDVPFDPKRMFWGGFKEIVGMGD